jgi:UDP-N-acetylglucosamine/UDP-N-acetylgalactosamine 4-epimerase
MEPIAQVHNIDQVLKSQPLNWLVTGAAGFIGSNICLKLIETGQSVLGIDNFITGHQKNIDFLTQLAKEYPDASFGFMEGDIRRSEFCEKITIGRDKVLHQAALGSVPRSISDPLASHDHNVNGFINMANACRLNQCDMVYASSSSVYGDSPKLPKTESETGRPLSPYAATKAIDELYAEIFSKTYNMRIVGLRYFNVFGPRQDPNGPYAAVIPKWVQSCMRGERPEIYGDGETSRDFCYVENAVQANILAALNIKNCEHGEVFNVAAERKTTLNQLLCFIQQNLAKLNSDYIPVKAEYKAFRPGDIRHSLADVSKARRMIGYNPLVDVEQGLQKCTEWYLKNL